MYSCECHARPLVSITANFLGAHVHSRRLRTGLTAPSARRDLWLRQAAVGRVWANFALCETLACMVGERFSFPIVAIAASCDPLVNRKNWLPGATKHLLRSHFMIVPDDHFFLDMWRRFAETVTETLRNSMVENDN